MKIRWCRGDVPQAGHAQNFRFRRGQWMESSVSLEKIATDIYGLVTGNTSQRFEQPMPVQFPQRQRGYTSCQPPIESAARCYESSLKAYEGIGDVAGVRAAAV